MQYRVVCYFRASNPVFLLWTRIERVEKSTQSPPAVKQFEMVTDTQGGLPVPRLYNEMSSIPYYLIASRLHLFVL